MNPPFASRETLVRVFFFSAFALILYQLCLLAQPFATAIAGAAMLAIMFYPLHRLILRKVRQPDAAAFMTTFAVLLVAVLPLIGLVWLFIRETSDLVPLAQQFLEDLRNRDWPAFESRLPEILRHAADHIFNFFARVHVDLRQVLLENAHTLGIRATAWATQVLKNIVVTLLNVLILCLALFFAFRDGERFLQWALSLVPMQARHKQTIAARVYETFRAVVVGSILTATAQGAAALVGYLIAGVHLPVVLGIGTAMASMLGFSILVTLPVALSVLRVSTAWGIFLLVWAFGVVGVLDNVLKPFLIGSRARMPFVLIFFSIVGGIKYYGLLGFILGPMLVASFLSFVKIYSEEYNERRGAVTSDVPSIPADPYRRRG